MDPLIFVIFGASGDLARRKLIPAIFELYKENHLPADFAVLGVSRSSLSDEAFRDKVFWKNSLMDAGSPTSEQSIEFSKRLFYEAIDTLDSATYGAVTQRLGQLDETLHTQGNYIFYLSTPPSLYSKIPESLAHQGLNVQNGSWRRLVIEKPFGYDQTSARQLNKDILQHFEEEQIYRIDHYLGKETVQNLLVTRFSNGVFEPLWNRNFIHHVEITNAEPIGVGGRGGYYDQSGALRDMLQNHLMQIVAHVAMEPPINTDARSIRDEKVKLFQSIQPIRPEDIPRQTVRGQYLSSMIDGETVRGYREEEGVPNDSRTETYAAVKFFIDNWRWAGVPFYIRTGKRLPTKVTEVTIAFKHPPHTLFRNENELLGNSNRLVIRIQPDEGILMNFGMKIPGEGFRVKNVGMDFHYSDLTHAHVPEAYERLLLDCMKGDATLYARGDSVEYSWAFVEPILDAWANNEVKMFGYPSGSWGPKESNDLIVPEDLSWRNPCPKLTETNNYCEL